jgi:hypothetical protein
MLFKINFILYINDQLFIICMYAYIYIYIYTHIKFQLSSILLSYVNKHLGELSTISYNLRIFQQNVTILLFYRNFYHDEIQ